MVNIMADLNKLEIFTYVAQYSSITKASAALGITKSSLSKQIKFLEHELQVDLFSRTKQRLQLTEQGEILLMQCLRLKKELDDTRSLCQQFTHEPEGHLHLMVFEYFANKLIFPRLKGFLQQYPKLECTITISEKIPEFEKEKVDIAVGYSLPAPLDVVRKRITSTHYVLCASSLYLSKYGIPTNLQELQTHLYIGHSSRPLNRIIRLNPSHSLHIKPYIQLNSVSSMIECARLGLGIIQLPVYLLENFIEKGELVEILQEYQARNANVYYYYPKYRFVQPKVRKFIEYFLNPREMQ